MNRQYSLDWLRIITIGFLIPFHTARIFDFWEPNYVKNDELSPLLSYFIAITAVWNMPLLFFIAGMATWYSLETRSNTQFIKERITRLAVPFFFGMLVVVPPQAYIARFQNSGSNESYLRFLLDYFAIRGDLTGYTGLFTPAHLWFILYLFVFALAGLPLFHFIRKKQRLIKLEQRVHRISLIPLAFILAPLVAGALPDIGGKNPFTYFVLYFYGFLFAGNHGLQKILEQYKRTIAGFAFLTMILCIVVWLHRPSLPKYSLGDVAWYMLRTATMWGWVLMLIGYSHQFLTVNNWAYCYLNEASYPVYILHQTIIMLIGHFVVRWPLGVWPKFFIIISVATFLIWLIYEIGVRRIVIMRILFGMKGSTFSIGCIP